MTTHSDNITRLSNLLGFDPSKPDTGAAPMLTEALEEVRKEREAKTKIKVKEFITKAIEIQDQMVQAKNAFDAQYAKLDKGLGKLLSQIDALAKGRPAPAEAATSAEEGTQP
jgi:hypothetical protein